MNKFWSLLFAGTLGGLVVFGADRLTEREQPQSAAATANGQPARQVLYTAAPVGFDFTKAAERSMDAVVHIKASESKQNALKRQRQSNPFRLFFGEDYYPFEEYIQPRSGTGSGVIYNGEGYILTNNHVVEFADEFEVTLHDDRTFKARLVGRDPNTDMAVVKIDAENLSPIEIGNSDEVKVGEWVLAVGNPFDLTSTVTAGIISAKSRDINIINSRSAIESFIQTDAAVNPGNSGGALVDINGRLIGINSAIATPTGTFAGYSFAIPVNLAIRIADDLIKYGEYRRPYIGVDIVPMDEALARELNVPFVKGVAVVDMDPNGSAASAGIEVNDIVVKANGKNVTSLPELLEIVGRSKVGDNLNLTVVRKGKERDFNVRLRARNQG